MTIHLKPNPAQERFLRAFRPGRQLLLCSGVGIGKTWIMAFSAARLAWLNPGVNGLIVSHVLNHVRTEIIPLVVEHLKETGLYAGETKQDRMIHLMHGGSIQYGSADTPKTLDGKNVGWLLGDEIRYWPKASYDKATSRVRVKEAQYPMQAFTTTPEMNWIYDEFALKKGKVVLHGKTTENIDNLQADYYDRLAGSLDAGTYSQYVDGNWVSTSGSVYGQEYDKEACVQDLGQIYGHPVMMGMDPGIRTPALVFFQHLPWCQRHNIDHCIHVLDELVPDDTPLTRLLVQIDEMYERKVWTRGRGQGTIYLDPFGGNQRDQIHGATVMEKLREAGYTVELSYNPKVTNVLNGIAAVQGRLLNVRGERRLFFDRCMQRDGITPRNILRAIQSYRWPERKSGQAIKNEPVHDETSHVMDALRYPIVNLFPPAINRATAV